MTGHDTEQRTPGGTGWIGALVTSAEGVYGLIVVAGVIVVSSDLGDATTADVVLSATATLLVFFAAHVYAAVLSWLTTVHDEGRDLGTAVRHGLRDSAGMLLVGVLPVLALCLGMVGIVRATDAVWLALGVDVLLLGLLGWFIATIRTSQIWVRLGSALVTAAFGGALILLKAAVHH